MRNIKVYKSLKTYSSCCTNFWWPSCADPNFYDNVVNCWPIWKTHSTNLEHDRPLTKLYCQSSKCPPMARTQARRLHIYTPLSNFVSALNKLSVQKWSVGAIPSTWNFGSNWSRWSEITDFRSIFARSASAVTPSEKVQLTFIESPQHAFQWTQNEHRTMSLSPQRGLKKRSVQNLNNKLR